MYDFYYKYVKNRFGDKAELLFADTNSSMHEIETEKMEHFYKGKELFDFSICQKESNYYNTTDNLIVGKMRDKTCGVPIKVFVRLKAKIYTYITDTNHECKKLKGIDKNVVDDEPNHEYYKNVLFNGTYMRHEINRTQIKDPNIGTYRINNRYLKTKVTGYHIFINVLVNHTRRK